MRKNKNKKVKKQREICQYCGKPLIVVPKCTIKAEAKKEEQVLVCSGYPICDSYVSLNPKYPELPVLVANPQLRRLRWIGHALFDAIVKLHISGRTTLYALLSEKIMVREVHFGQMNEEYCEYAIVYLKAMLEEAPVYRKMSEIEKEALLGNVYKEIS